MSGIDAAIQPGLDGPSLVGLVVQAAEPEDLPAPAQGKHRRKQEPRRESRTRLKHRPHYVPPSRRPPSRGPMAGASLKVAVAGEGEAPSFGPNK